MRAARAGRAPEQARDPGRAAYHPGMHPPEPPAPYPKVDPRPSFPALERAVLARWRAEGTFERSVAQRPAGARGANEFVFYDGPPFANGLPHYGHLLTSYVKDVVPRYQTMRGRRVERRFGWDCHGLPAEMQTERELGVAGRQQIQAYGIDRFNAACRTSVLRYTKEWERYVTRMARWVDFAHDYKTLDLTYMESVLWAFRQLYDKGLVYEAYRVMPYSWAAETPVSNFETRLDNAYRMRQDPAITVRLRLSPEPGDPGPMELWIWTTTPWTLPSNLAVAVGPDLDYALFRVDGRVVVVGAEAAERYRAELGAGAPIGTVAGRRLVGRRYEPLFPYFAGHPNAFVVLGGGFVATDEGTGLVHMAPGFGEDDQQACEAAGIQLVVPVDEAGRFTAEVVDFAGLNVLEANKPILRRLKEAGALVRQETIDHNYPHCWRTDQPLIYRAVSSWYVRVTAFRDRMVELNRGIRWIPEHVRDGQFGKWLEGARDWSISRNRFWGSPIPIWRSDDPRYPRVDCYGSLDEIERDFGVRPTDLHRPFVDALERPNPDDPTGRSRMRRVPEVLDCWFESGSMPFAQVHYPFENRAWFEDHFPADFIVEYVAQTRGWFYTLMVLGTALFDKPPFRNCMCHGLVLDAQGQKLSKRLRNYPDPEAVFETHGADALRWFLMSSPILRGGDLRIDPEGKGIAEMVRLVHGPIWNAYYFFTLYANADGYRATDRTDSAERLDRYVLAKTRALVEAVTRAMDDYDLAAACAEVTGFLDALNNWYIRRSRDRFWAGGARPDGPAAFDTLLSVLVRLCRVAAPLLPFLCEEVHTGLVGGPSVHLCDWPDPEALPADPALVADMDRVREVCSAALSLREAHGLRVRLPLAELVVAGAEAPRLEPLADLLRDEVNVKRVRFSADLAAHGEFVLVPDMRRLGPRLGPRLKAVMAAARAGQWTRTADGAIEAAGERLDPEEFEVRLKGREGEVSQALKGNDLVVVLDTRVTPDLKAEGQARDLVRLIQQARKDADLGVSDRIALFLEPSPEVAPAVRRHEAWIAEQVLASRVAYAAAPDGAWRADGAVDGGRVTLGFTRAGG